MVRHQHGRFDYWTLPGGGAEDGESPREAIIREVREEVNLEVEPIRLLFEKEFHTDVADTIEQCFLCRIVGIDTPSLGLDPELDRERQILKAVAWFTLEDKKSDIQVREVIAAMEAYRDREGK